MFELMTIFTSFLGTVVGVLVYVTLGVTLSSFWILGIFRLLIVGKYKKGILAFCFPPFGIYQGVYLVLKEGE